MRPSWIDKVEKVAFVLGLAVLAYLGGFATRMFGWPPDTFIQRAWLQANAVTHVGAPDFTAYRVYDEHGVRTPMPDRMQPGLTLISTLWRESEWVPGLKLIDARGRVLHRWTVEPETGFSDSAKRRGIGWDELDVQGLHLFPDGDVLVNLEYVGTIRMDACSQVRWRLPAGGHHSIHPAEDGSFWLPGVTPEAQARSPGHPAGFPGLGKAVYQDWLLRVTPQGQAEDTINLLDVLFENDLAHHLAKTRRTSTTDPIHVNDVEPLSSAVADEYPLFDVGDLVVSSRNLDLVFVLDPETERVKWHASDPFIRQHDPDFLGDGWIGIFDNRPDGTGRGEMLGGSRIVAVQPHTDSTVVLFPTSQSDPFFTSVRGKWQRLANGNLLLTEAEAGRVVEVSPEGRTVWEWIVEPYSDDRIPFVSEGRRVDLTPAEVASWPCSPTPSSDNEERAAP